MAASMLIVITYMAGASWGPLVSITPLPSLLECIRTRAFVAKGIERVARSNSTTQILTAPEKADLVVSTGVGGREVARISCASAGEVEKDGKG